MRIYYIPDIIPDTWSWLFEMTLQDSYLIPVSGVMYQSSDIINYLQSGQMNRYIWSKTWYLFHTYQAFSL